MRRGGAVRLGAWCATLCAAAAAAASGATPPEGLPEPLTLETAMAFAEAPHPQLERARADLALARAERRGAEARTGLEVTAEAGAEVLDPSDVADDPGKEDYRLELTARKSIYDFGRREARVAAAEAGVQSSQVELAAARQQRRLDIMRGFFDVILADLRYARDNEAMAVAFVELDRTRGRNELGQASDIALAEAQAHYQELRRRRYQSDAQRRTARARLAQVLNRPNELPGELVEPELPGNERQRPEEVTPLIERALTENARLHALRAEARSLEHEVRALELDVRQAVRETWERIGVLQAQRDAVRAETEYRELYLDRSRTRYAQELQADLGDSMVRWSEARLERARTEFALAQAWGRLDALLGRKVMPEVGGDGG